MSKALSRGLCLVLFTGGLTLLGTTVANAADTSGDDGVLSGTQIVAAVAAPIDVVGNSVSVLGDAVAAAPASAAPAAAAPVAPAPDPSRATTSGDDSLLGGTQAVVDAVVPVTIGGNAVSLTGDATSIGTPLAPAAAPAAATPAPAPTTSGSDSIASGTQIVPVVSIPVNVGGNAISVLGDADSSGSTTNTGTTNGTTGNGATTSGNDSVAGGTQVAPDLALPITIGGNAVSVLGDAATSGSTTGTGTTNGSTGNGATTSGDDSIAGGTQVAPDLALPITIGGNAVSVLGDSESAATVTSNAPEGTSDGGTSSGDDSSTDGNDAPVLNVPVSDTPAQVGTVDSVGTSVAAIAEGAAAVVVVDSGATATTDDASSTPTALAMGAITSGVLASTGIEIAPVLSLAALLLLSGLALARIGRRTATTE
jgi:hypothetical protein